MLVRTPVFRYGLRAATCPPWTNVRLRVVRADGDPAREGEATVCEAQAVAGYLLFEFDDLAPEVRYDGFLLHDGKETPLFRGAELYRLAIDDPSYRVLPNPAP